MPARTPREALEEFVTPLKAVAACLTSIGLITTGTDPARAPHSVSFLGKRPVRLSRQGNRPPLLFYTAQGYRTDREAGVGWLVRITSWAYQVEDAATGREWFSYHWHPAARSRVVEPHLHISARTDPPDVAAAHYPTGVVTLADVARLLIEEFEVLPTRSDWQRVLEHTRQDPHLGV